MPTGRANSKFLITPTSSLSTSDDLIDEQLMPAAKKMKQYTFIFIMSDSSFRGHWRRREKKYNSKQPMNEDLSCRLSDRSIWAQSHKWMKETFALHKNAQWPWPSHWRCRYVFGEIQRATVNFLTLPWSIFIYGNFRFIVMINRFSSAYFIHIIICFYWKMQIFLCRANFGCSRQQVDQRLTSVWCILMGDALYSDCFCIYWRRPSDERVKKKKIWKI